MTCSISGSSYPYSIYNPGAAYGELVLPDVFSHTDTMSCIFTTVPVLGTGELPFSIARCRRLYHLALAKTANETMYAGSTREIYIYIYISRNKQQIKNML